MLNFDAIPLDDKQTYEFLSLGLTHGIFQLEEHLGERYAQVVKPKTIEDIADIVSIIRPGCKEALHTDGKTSMLEAYCKIRTGEMKPTYLHEDLRPILESTNSVLIYQEQIIEICRKMAGMTLEQGDMVRKAMGKKLPEEMKVWEDTFLNGCMKQGYTEDLAKTLWIWIDKSSGYLFNKSHAVAYAYTAYKTAYAKSHYPTEFYMAMLKYADKKSDTYEEMLCLVNDAKLFDIRVIPPSLKEAHADFTILNKRTIMYGVQYLKGIGAKSTKIVQRLKGCDSWLRFLVDSDKYNLDKTSCEALIKSGCLDYLELPRTKMLADYTFVRTLTNNEKAIIFSLMTGILHADILVEIDNTDFTNKRTQTKWKKIASTGIFDLCGKYGPIANLDLPVNTFETKKMSLVDATKRLLESSVLMTPRVLKITEEILQIEKTYAKNPALYSMWEKHYFGIPLTCTDKNMVVDLETTPCIEVINIPSDSNVKVAGVIERISYAKIKRGQSAGQTMAFIDLADNSYILKGIIAFSECYAQNSAKLVEGNAVSLRGRKMKNGNSLIVYAVENL